MTSNIEEPIENSVNSIEDIQDDKESPLSPH